MPIARAKGLECEVVCRDGDAMLNTDLQKLKQILVNLAGNAVKYTERGKVKLEYCTADGRLTAAISDTGVGIPAEHIDRVFEPFWQVDPGKKGRPGGSGLGLSVSRSLAALLGGEIRVQSELGKGSVFTLEVPVASP